MEEAEKRLFDALAEIKRAAFARIHERREGEWKLTLSIWGGLAGLTAIMLEKPEAAKGLAVLPYWSIVVAGLLLLALHFAGRVAGAQRNQRRPRRGEL